MLYTINFLPRIDPYKGRNRKKLEAVNADDKNLSPFTWVFTMTLHLAYLKSPEIVYGIRR